MPDAAPLHYGSRCDRYNLKKKTRQGGDVGAFEYRKRTLFECAQDGDVVALEHGRQGERNIRIGVPMGLVYWQLLPLFARFFGALGFEVVFSGRTDKRIIRMGVESVSAQPCFPVKVAYGHIAELIDKGVDYILLPSIVSMSA
ncbi:MAG: acyl-CoA dehydratase activase-related protein, partial [Planctomycetota bacterium]